MLLLVPVLPLWLFGQPVSFLADLQGVDQQLWSDFPATWQAKGRVYDQYGTPVPGALVRNVELGSPGVFSDPSGHFSLGEIGPETIIWVEKKNHLSGSFRAADLNWFFTSETEAEVRLSLPVFDLSFEVGPRGGQYRGKLDIDVPVGAVDEMIEIKAVLLPPGYHPERGNEPRPVSYGSVYFEPSGLQFRKPIRIRQTSAGGIIPENGDPALLQVIQGISGTELIPVPGANLNIAADNWHYSLSHFSEYRLVDQNHLVKTYDPGINPADHNMDGAVNEQDAERILKLEGGTQTYNYTLSFHQTQTIAEFRTATDRSGSEDAQGQEGKADFGGLGVEASTEVNVKRANELLRKFEIKQEVSSENTFSVSMATGEKFTACEMIFARYNFRRLVEYRKHEPLEKEKEAIEKAYNEHKKNDQEWVDLRVSGGVSHITLGQSLYDGQGIAVRKNGNELEVYVRFAVYTLRTLRGFESGNCERYTSKPDHRLRYAQYDPPQIGKFYYSLEYKGYFPLSEPDDQHFDCECGNQVERTIRETRSRMDFKEITASSETALEKNNSASAGGSIKLPGGLGLGGSVSSKTSRTQAASKASGFGANTTDEDKTELKYVVVNQHTDHESDHNFYRLYHLFELRDWDFMFPDELNISDRLKRNMRSRIKSTGLPSTRGQTSDGRLILLWVEEGKEYWYVAGPPVEIIREAGYLLKRIEERPCGEENPPSEGRATFPRPWRFRGGVTIPEETGTLTVTGPDLMNGFNEAVFGTPGVFEDLQAALGGEFVLGNLSGGALDNSQLSGRTDLIPGLAFGRTIFPGLELGFGAHFFQTAWSGTFPLVVFPEEGTSPPRTMQGHLQAEFSGMLIDFGATYLFMDQTWFCPYIESGIRARWVTDHGSGATIGDVVLPFEVETPSNALNLYGGAGIRINAGKRLFFQAGALFTEWPGSKFGPGGSANIGLKF
ncbi:MAG: carboxypeptidase regulatory-like domain-containing protein [Saprospiraceae bacterium]|nr:carboxypeptidase regulatory-like domain-containing protein [Saprospiraceae bacterium]